MVVRPVPNSWMVYNGESFKQWIWGYHYFRTPPYIQMMWQLHISSHHIQIIPGGLGHWNHRLHMVNVPHWNCRVIFAVSIYEIYVEMYGLKINSISETQQDMRCSDLQIIQIL